jgi:hypothetical protein
MTKLMNLYSAHVFSDLPRVCIPYRLDILDLARWLITINTEEKNPEFKLIAGDSETSWQGSDVIDLYNHIQSFCVSYKLASSYVYNVNSNSLFYFDLFDRFIAFSGERFPINYMYPFSREVMWENFNLYQNEDDDFELKEIFDCIHSASLT